MPPELPILPYGRQWLDDEDIAAVVACLRGDWLTQGPMIEKFEQSLCSATDARFAVAVSSGTAALHLAALAAGVHPSDTGITSANTFVASANCIAYCGGEPQFADIDPATGLIDLDSLERTTQALAAAGRAPKVIVPVDFAGQAADLPRIQAIAQRYGAKVIEDAAHSLGGRYQTNGQPLKVGCGSHADFAILSFHPVKHVTTAEGGAVLTNDPAAAARLRDLRTHGIHRDPPRLTRPDEGPWYYEQAELGFHYRITDLQCSLGLSQMAKLESFIIRRNELATRYDVALAQEPLIEWLRPLRTQPPCLRNAYHLYVVRLIRRAGESLADLATRRKQLYLALRERRIFTQVHYIPVPMQPFYQRHGTPGNFPGASEYYASCLSLPLYPKMSDADADRVVAALAEVFVR